MLERACRCGPSLMTRQPIRNRIAALALVLQVFAVFGTTRGIVLCVGPAAHVAEDTQAAARCKASQVDFADASGIV